MPSTSSAKSDARKQPGKSEPSGMRLAWKRLIHGSSYDFVKELPAFAPYSKGSYGARRKLAVLAANQVFPLLSLCQEKLGRSVPMPISAESFCASEESRKAALRLAELFNQHGSDKSTRHDYHFVYGRILEKRDKIGAILEIGLGSNNRNVVSNMGRRGRPGASLRAFRDYLPEAEIFGADVDRRILFQEPGIKTYFVDQTDLESFEALSGQVTANLDLIIDDGLHSPNANLAVLMFALDRLKIGNWLVIEDIAEGAMPIWQLVATLLPPELQSHLIAAKGGLLFAVEKIA